MAPYSEGIPAMRERMLEMRIRNERLMKNLRESVTALEQITESKTQTAILDITKEALKGLNLTEHEWNYIHHIEEDEEPEEEPEQVMPEADKSTQETLE
jgi:hypothetical protein